MACAVSCVLLASPQGEAVADQLPPGFYETTVIEPPALSSPTAIAFAPDGDLFVAEKNGILLRFDGLDDLTPDVVLDFREEANNFGDRGFLGLALDPNYLTNHYAYISYTYDAPVGGTAPTHALPPPEYDDSCVDECEVTARIERLDLSGTMPVPRSVLIQDDYCNQFQSHSIGTLAFDSQRRLYVGGGDGANYNVADYGQHIDPGNPEPQNPCGDPGGPEGSPLSPPNAEGGALRSQDFWTMGDPVNDPLGLSGTIVRIDPDTGYGDPDNPEYNAADPDSNESRILAYGLRNPFRFTVSPDSSELWIGDTGWKTKEEIDSFATDSTTIPNFGWPCYEGVARQPEYDPLDLTLCESLYAAGPGAVQTPTFDYDHHAELYPGDPCPVPGGGSASSGITFYTGNSFPSEYDGSLFFADYARYCIWHVPADVNGTPDFSQMEAFDQNLAAPVDLKIGPDGALYYVDNYLGEIHRIQHTAGNVPPVAVAAASPEYGTTPLTVNFDATGSSDADPGDTLTYEWDLNGDGDYSDPEDSTSATPTHMYNTAQTVTVRLRVSDGSPETDTDTIRIDVGNRPPVPQITSPAPGTTWTVGQQLNFHGEATDPDQGTLPPSSISWDVTLNHCVTGGGCHDHHQTSLSGDDDLQLTAPHHGYPAHLTIEMTAIDDKGLARRTTLELQPSTVSIQAQSTPANLVLQLNDVSGPTPQTLTAIQGSQVQAIAPSPQALNATNYNWCEWSDAGSRIHTFTAATSMTLSATYAANCPPTNIVLSNSSFAENQSTGATVGTLSTTDPDAGSHTYSLVAGTGDTDNARFQIDGSTLKTVSDFDYETKSSYTVRIRTNDGSTSFAKAFAITVIDANDPPSGPTISSGWIAENLPAGTRVAELATNDPDVGDSARFAFADGEASNDNGDFRLDGSALVTARSFDFEADPDRNIRLAVIDAAGLRSEQAFTLAVADVEDLPSAITLSNASIGEHLPTGTAVGDLTADDQDAGDSSSFALVPGPGARDNADFAISGATLSTASELERNEGTVRNVRIRATDQHGGVVEREFTIAVLANPLVLDVVRLKVPDRPSQLLENGVRALLRCTTGCRAQIELEATGRLARRLGLHGTVGSERARLTAGEEQWVTAELDRRSQRLLTDYDGNRMPNIDPSFEAKPR